MRRTAIRLSLLVMLAGLSSTGQAQQDPFLGTWKQNMAKSKYDPADLAAKVGTTVRRTAAGTNGYKTTTDGVNAQGAATHTESTATLDGKDYPLTGSADWDALSMKRIDAYTLISVSKRGGVVVRMLRTVVSKDGKTTTSEQIGYNAKGIAFHNVAVFDKQ